jgi:hypothetical protein
MRFRLRTLLIVLAILPPLVAGTWWRYSAWQAEQAKQRAIEAEADPVAEHAGQCDSTVGGLPVAFHRLRAEDAGLGVIP